MCLNLSDNQLFRKDCLILNEQSIEMRFGETQDKLNSWQTRREAGTQSLGDFEIKVSPVAIQTAKKRAGRILQSDFLFVTKK